MAVGMIQESGKETGPGGGLARQEAGGTARHNKIKKHVDQKWWEACEARSVTSTVVSCFRASKIPFSSGTIAGLADLSNGSFLMPAR